MRVFQQTARDLSCCRFRPGGVVVAHLVRTGEKTWCLNLWVNLDIV